jgi:hypothetical protein
MSLTHTPSIAELEGFKLTFRQKSHHPLSMPQHEHLSASRVVFAPVGESIVLGDRGKKRFEPRYCPPEQIIIKKPISPPKRNNTPPRGKRCILVETNLQQDEQTHSKKIFAEMSQKRSDSTPNLAVGWKSRGKVCDENGKPAKDKESGIYNLEASMNRKQRVSAGDLKSRNYIPEATPGDKPLKKAEHTPGYYAEGGLIAGSTIQERKTINSLANKSNVEITNSKKLEATYGTMQKRLAFEYDQKQVESLTVRQSKLFSF